MKLLHDGLSRLGSRRPQQVRGVDAASVRWVRWLPQLPPWLWPLTSLRRWKRFDPGTVPELLAHELDSPAGYKASASGADLEYDAVQGAAARRPIQKQIQIAAWLDLAPGHGSAHLRLTGPGAGQAREVHLIGRLQSSARNCWVGRPASQATTPLSCQATGRQPRRRNRPHQPPADRQRPFAFAAFNGKAR